MINWNFNANDVDEGFSLISSGDHRVRIAEVNERVSRNGNDMIELKLDVSGESGSLFTYIVFLPDNTTLTNTNLKRFYESFGIEKGSLNTASWIGKVGGARVKHEEYNGELQARVSYFLDKKKQETLPAWKEKGGTVQVTEFPF